VRQRRERSKGPSAKGLIEKLFKQAHNVDGKYDEKISQEAIKILLRSTPLGSSRRSLLRSRLMLSRLLELDQRISTVIPSSY
jgi:hypothetical protein